MAARHTVEIVEIMMPTGDLLHIGVGHRLMIDPAVNIEVRKELGRILALLVGVMTIINLLTVGHQSGAALRQLDVLIMNQTITMVIVEVRDITAGLSPTWTEAAARGSSFLAKK